MKRNLRYAFHVGALAMLLWLFTAQLQVPRDAVVADYPPPTMPTRPTIVETIPPSPTPTLTVTPSPTATPTPRPVHLPLLYRQLIPLLNGSFSSGSFAPGWRLEGNLPQQVVTTERRSPPFAALLGDPGFDNMGGAPAGYAAIYQVVDVPYSGNPELRFWYRLHSFDTIQFDYFIVEIARWSDGAYEELYRDGCLTWHLGIKCPRTWEVRTIPLDPWRGKRISIRFANVMTNKDGYYNTWTYVDSVALIRRP